MVSVLLRVLALVSLATSKPIDTALSAPKLTGSKTGVIILTACMPEEGEGQPFEEIAKQFSSRREDTTPNAPFLDEKSVFEEEAPSSAQRRLALDFYNGLSTLVEKQQGRYPTPLDIVELHQLHVEAIRNNIPQGEIIPEYTLMHVIGAGERLSAYTYASEQYASEAAFTQLRSRQANLEAALWDAAHIEAIGYPLVIQREAVTIQQTLQEEARHFLEKTNSEVIPELIRSRVLYAGVQYFPEEHPQARIRKSTSGAFLMVESALRRNYVVLETAKQFDVRAALAEATRFGHNDLDRYSLDNVYGASKRAILAVDVRRGWNIDARNTFAAHKLLTQAVANRPQA